MWTCWHSWHYRHYWQQHCPWTRCLSCHRNNSLSHAAQLGLANGKLHGRHPTATAESQKPPALNAKGASARAKGEGVSSRVETEIKQCIPNLQTHPPTRQSAPWQEGLSSPSADALRKARRNPVNGREVLAMDKVVPALHRALLDCFFKFDYLFFHCEAVHPMTLFAGFKQESEIHFITSSLTPSKQHQEFWINLILKEIPGMSTISSHSWRQLIMQAWILTLSIFILKSVWTQVLTLYAISLP